MGVQQEESCEKLEKRENDKDLPVPTEGVPAKENYTKGKAIPAPLPVIETWLYVLGWSFAVGYCIYNVYKSSYDYQYNLNKYDFKPGWSWTGRKQDVSDFEWGFFPWFFFKNWYWMLGHTVIGQVLQWTGFKHKKYVMVAYSCVAMLGIFGPKLFGLLLLAATLMHLSTFSGSVAIVWITSLLILGTLNWRKTLGMLREIAEPDPYRRNFNMMVFTLSWTTMRCVSFCVEAVKASRSTATKSSPEKTKESGDQAPPVPSVQGYYTYWDHLGYIFYLPLACSGPVMTYNIFQVQYNAEYPPLTFAKLKDIVKYFLRLLFWYFAIELGTHYLYLFSFIRDYHIMQQLPLWALAGVGYLSGQFFQMKYVVMYGLPGAIAKFDQLEAPKTPKCVARIYLYSDMWRYFDRGLYDFLKRYIYVPMGGSRKGMHRQFLGSFVCFSYVYFWHGAENYLLLWTFLNFVGISMEATSSKICATQKVQNIENNITGLAMGRRIRAFLAVPQTVMSIIAIFYFFSGFDVGTIFFNRLVWNIGVVTFLNVYIFVYCLVQTSMEVTRWEAKWEAKCIKTD